MNTLARCPNDHHAYWLELGCDFCSGQKIEYEPIIPFFHCHNCGDRLPIHRRIFCDSHCYVHYKGKYQASYRLRKRLDNE